MYRILCAFQSEEIFEFVKSALSVIECELVKASSEALALFLVDKNLPCLVISELQPETGWGMNLLTDLKGEEGLRSIPLVFLSRTQPIPPSGLPAGAEALLGYPIENSEFLGAIRKYLHEIKDERIPDSPE